MTGDYISREAAISGLDELEKTSYHNSVLWPDHVEECRETLRYIPAADVRPVVRCRDCKHSDTFAPDCTEATFPLKCLSIRYGGFTQTGFVNTEKRGRKADANG